MKNIIITLLLIFSSQAVLHAQKTYVYLEVDKNIPVTLRMNEQFVPNPNKGYIIIPKVKQGDNKLAFTFQNPSIKKHTFYFQTINGKSNGYKLRKIANNEFVLESLTTKQLLYNNDQNATAAVVQNNTQKAQGEATDIVRRNNPLIQNKPRTTKKGATTSTKEDITFKSSSKTKNKKLGVLKVLKASDANTSSTKKTQSTGVKEVLRSEKTNTKKTNKVYSRKAIAPTTKKAKEKVVKEVKNKKSYLSNRYVNTDTIKTKRNYAMYQQRQRVGSTQANKNKNYRKINRAKKKAAKLKKAQAKTKDISSLDQPTRTKKTKDLDQQLEAKKIARAERARAKAAATKKAKELKKQEEALAIAKQKAKASAQRKEKEAALLAKQKKEAADAAANREAKKASAKELKRKKAQEKEALRKEIVMQKAALAKKKQQIAERKKAESALLKEQAAAKQKELSLKKAAEQKIKQEAAARKEIEIQAKKKEAAIAQVKKEEEKAARLAKKVKRKRSRRKNNENVDDFISSMKKEIIDPEPSKVVEPTYEAGETIAPINPNDYVSSRCPRLMDMSTAENISTQLSEKFDDQARLNYIKKNMGSACYTTDHINLLLKSMSTQNGKFKMVKTLYPQIADQGNMNRLFNEFKFKSYRKKISQLAK